MTWQIEHVGLAAADTLALKDWYVRVLGASVLFDNQERPPAFLLRFCGGMLFEIYPAHTGRALAADNRTAGWRHLALRVESIERARAELASRGVAFSEPVKPAGGGGRVQFFSDPEGNLWHLLERQNWWPLPEDQQTNRPDAARPS